MLWFLELYIYIYIEREREREREREIKQPLYGSVMLWWWDEATLEGEDMGEKDLVQSLSPVLGDSYYK